MDYQVIARKYRPQRFEDVVGQEHVTETLSQAIEQNRIAHAYLFCGPRGTGKTTIARIFAKCLNCTDGPKVKFSDKDPRCQEIAEGRSLDVLEIDGASNNSVDQVRELRETCKYLPASSKFKIYIIDEVHMLTTQAFNALLKTLEEPPPHVKFLFATTDPEKVLPTILSRCQRFDLRRIPAALIAKHLAHISKLEKVKIDQPALLAIARGAEGALRDAESTLDQLISFCGSEIEESDVLSIFGLAGQAQLFELTEAILAGEAEKAIRQVHTLANGGKDLGRLLSDLLNHFRNLLIFQVSKGDVTMLEVSDEEIAVLTRQAKLLNSDGLTRIMEVFSDAEMRLRDASSKKILVEVALLKAIEARKALSIDSVLKQLYALRPGGSGENADTPPSGPPAGTRSHPDESSGPSKKPSPVRAAPPSTFAELTAAPAVQSIPTTATVVPPQTALAADLAELWARLVESVGRSSQFTKSYLLEAHPVSFSGNLFTIGFGPEAEDHIGLIDNSKNHSLLQAKLQEFGHGGVQFKFVKAPTPPGFVIPITSTQVAVPAYPHVPAGNPKPEPTIATAKSAPPAANPPPAREKLSSVPFNRDEFKNDPLIAKALEIFKGQIVDVRA